MFDICSIAPSNMCIYYAIKLISELKLENTTPVVIVKSDELKISVPKLLTSQSKSPKVVINDIGNILESISKKYTKTELQARIKACAKYICTIANTNPFIVDHFILLSVLQFMITIYVLKKGVTPKVQKYLKSGVYNFGEFINYISNITLKHLIKTNELNNTNLAKVTFTDPIETESNNKLSFDYLDAAIKKYKDQIDIDVESYLTHISLAETNPADDKDSNNQNINTFFLRKPNFVDLTQKIDTEFFNSEQNPNWYFTYQKYQDNVITKDYGDVKKLGSLKKLNNEDVKLLKDINPIIATNANNIYKLICTLFKVEFIEPISTLTLLHQYVLPAFSNLSFSSQLFLLYKIVIPYLYDKKNITAVIDHFFGETLINAS
jgi:hypothetical protein